MAEPISLGISPRDPRQELLARLALAPADHAEALLEAYEVLQQLHERKVFAVLRGALGAGDFMIDEIAGAAKSPAALNLIQNMIIFSKVIGSMDPQVLAGVVKAIEETALTKEQDSKPLGFWRLLFKMRGHLLRVMAFTNKFFAALDKHCTKTQHKT